MRVAIIGSRQIQEIDISKYIPPETKLIISGGATGVDTIAEEYADEHKISKLILRPEYKKYKRGAPLKRNEQIVEFADVIIAFWDGKSKGTLHTIQFAEKLGKKINIIICD